MPRGLVHVQRDKQDVTGLQEELAVLDILSREGICTYGNGGVCPKGQIRFTCDAVV